MAINDSKTVIFWHSAELGVMVEPEPDVEPDSVAALQGMLAQAHTLAQALREGELNSYLFMVVHSLTEAQRFLALAINQNEVAQ
jgi:hypothetical protein